MSDQLTPDVAGSPGGQSAHGGGRSSDFGKFGWSADPVHLGQWPAERYRDDRPTGLRGWRLAGLVSAMNRPVQPGSSAGPAPQVFYDAIQTDAPINPGNSGGPLVNARGQVIGVDAAIDTLGGDPLTGIQGGSIGLGFAIPVNQARRIIVQLIRTGYATHSVLGAALNENYAGAGAQIIPSRQRDQPVTPGGPAASAGLRPGDVITELGSQPIANAYSLMDAIRSVPPGSTVRVIFDRQDI